MRRICCTSLFAAAGLLATCAIPGCAQPAPAEAQASVTITTEILRPSPHRLGVNIGASNYYGDEQYVSNPLAHGGFSRGRQVLLIQSAPSTGNTVTDKNFLAADPDRHYVDSFAGGRYCIATGPRAGETGSILAHPAGTGTFTLENNGPPIAADELVWLHGPETSRAQPDPTDTRLERTIGIGDFRPVGDQGVTHSFASDGAAGQALQIAFSASGGEGGVRHYLRVIPGNTYTLIFRARCDAPDADLGVTLQHLGVAPSNVAYSTPMYQDRPRTLSGEWQEFRYHGRTFSDPALGSKPSILQITIHTNAGTPAHAYLDDIRLEDAALDTASGFTKEVLNTLREARCGVLRFYGIASLGALVEGITARNTTEAPWTYCSLQSALRFNQVDAVVDQWMQLSKEVDALPWLTIGGANMPEDWYHLISYLAAPQGFDDYADRRANHGFHAPWTDSFATVYLEIGNEWWNPIFFPYYAWPPEKYAQLCNTILRRIRQHPHYNPDKIKIICGGWAVNNAHWNGVVDRDAEGHHVISVAPYLLYELNDAGTREARYRALFASVDSSWLDGGASTRNDLDANGKGTRAAIYELNTHLTTGSVSRAVASEICTSAAAGVAVLDQAMHMMARLGTDPVNYFTLLQRSYDDRLGLWGNLIRPRQGGLRPRPVWHGLRLANQRLISGDMVRVSVDSPAWNQPQNGSVLAQPAVPLLHAYAFIEGTPPARRLNLLLINRALDQRLSITPTLPFPVSASVTVTQLAAERPDTNNEDTEKVQLNAGISPENGKLLVAPCSATVYQFQEAAP